MNLYKYKNYEEYISTQELGNIKKIKGVWVSKKVIDKICNYIKMNMKDVSFGLCHGTKRGIEQQYFIDNLGVDVIGTEISPTAENFPNTIRWDFHNIKLEWINNVDFIYTNAIDHCYDPEMAIKNWMKCLKKDGVLFIEHTAGHKRNSKRDPFGCSNREMKLFLNKFGNLIDQLKVRDLHGPRNKKTTFKIHVVKRVA